MLACSIVAKNGLNHAGGTSGLVEATLFRSPQGMDLLSDVRKPGTSVRVIAKKFYVAGLKDAGWNAMLCRLT
jgi:hypothetical protein